ncbi:uncharacterized protein A1O9_07159 [Exophiala aquamarina CBS 119918]|uniref:Methyltransferase domain-containing protein n=1 Tax=Exophiala aquamarina CBS 119918 TaxID=1182545 RepID=A0A072PA33_9EURO|nr:uncharacterized protein A1O9_07159 [Exophiala aquamarina CBS 119918]KEF56969.1 hypothetical protein A1O9_07159 [Exophiala aquamarina CBS 119918]
MASSQPPASTYTQGHSASAIASHTSRTVYNSAAFLLPHIKPNFTIIDLGCGPGTITCGFSSLVPEGSVIGVDGSSTIIEQARRRAVDLGSRNLNFLVADITHPLPFENDSVDVIYIHQTLCHIPSPVPVVQEAWRVLKPGGLIAMREYDHMSWYPRFPGVDAYTAGLNRSISASGAQGAESGRRLHAWAAQAGFSKAKMQVSAGTTCHVAAEAKWWAEVSIGRLEGEIGSNWLNSGTVKSQDDIEIMKRDLRLWGENEEAWYTALQGEVLAWK